MKEIIKEKLNKLTESNVIGQDKINEKISELIKKRDFNLSQIKTLKKEIKEIDDEIKKWQTISPNQTSLFDI